MVEPTALNKCSDCGELTDAPIDSYMDDDRIVCEDCNSHYQWCNVCQTYLNEELCRHLYYDDDGKLNGSGTYPSNWEENKYPFFALLNLIGREAAIALKASLENHKYHHQFSGTIFGVERINATWFVGDRVIHANPYFAPVFDDDLDNQEEITQAVNWLMSLYSGCYGSSWWEPDIDTPEQDLLTASWISDWLIASKYTSLANQDVFVIANGELKHYPAIYQNEGLKVAKLQWTNHFAVVHSSGFILPHSRTFDRNKAIAFCDICSHYPIVTYPIYQMFGDRKISLLQRAQKMAEEVAS